MLTTVRKESFVGTNTLQCTVTTVLTYTFRNKQKKNYFSKAAVTDKEYTINLH